MNILKVAKKIAKKYASDLNKADHWGFSDSGELLGPPAEFEPGDIVWDSRELSKAIFLGFYKNDALIHYLNHDDSREELTRMVFDSLGRKYKELNSHTVPVNRLKLVEKRK